MKVLGWFDWVDFIPDVCLTTQKKSLCQDVLAQEAFLYCLVLCFCAPFFFFFAMGDLYLKYQC